MATISPVENHGLSNSARSCGMIKMPGKVLHNANTRQPAASRKANVPLSQPEPSGHGLTEESDLGFPLKAAHASLDHAHWDFGRRFTL